MYIDLTQLDELIYIYQNKMKTRKPGKVYDYFDVCYEVNEEPALKKYESFLKE